MGFSDRHVRVFRFSTGKMIRKYDESLDIISDCNKDQETKMYAMDAFLLGGYCILSTG
jgi:peptidylprolyl isomerase domain and WD repeat-containing protein 1